MKNRLALLFIALALAACASPHPTISETTKSKVVHKTRKTLPVEGRCKQPVLGYSDFCAPPTKGNGF